MAILITGGTGFVGSCVARKLAQEEKEKLIIFDMFPNYDAVKDITERVEIVTGDLSEPSELMAVMKKYDISHVFHLAYSLGENYPLRWIRTIFGTNNLFEMARIAGVKRVIWASSGAVYGLVDTTDKPKLLSEDDRLMPDTLYGASKVFNEHCADIYAQQYGFDNITLRLNVMYGPGRAERSRTSSVGEESIYTKLVREPAPGEIVTTPPGHHLAPWSYVEDCAQAFYLAYKAVKPKHRVFNFMCEIRPISDTVEYLKSLFPNATYVMGNKGEHGAPYFKTDRIREELGFQPRYSMEMGIKETIELSRQM